MGRDEGRAVEGGAGKGGWTGECSGERGEGWRGVGEMGWKGLVGCFEEFGVVSGGESVDSFF